MFFIFLMFHHPTGDRLTEFAAPGRNPAFSPEASRVASFTWTSGNRRALATDAEIVRPRVEMQKLKSSWTIAFRFHVRCCALHFQDRQSMSFSSWSGKNSEKSSQPVAETVFLVFSVSSNCSCWVHLKIVEDTHPIDFPPTVLTVLFSVWL